MSRLRDQVVVVCHQIRSPDNLGSIARLMANFGFAELRLSDSLTYAFRDADKLAIKGTRILEGLKLCSSLDDALADCVFACGTTSRQEIKGRTTSTPEEAMERLAQRAAGGKVALVFGGEKRGLSDDELSRCDDILVIPTEEEQPSMNLSHSAAVLLYLCARQQTQTRADTAPAAALGTIQALSTRMQAVLSESGFLNPQAPEHVLRELSRSLVQGQITQREAELWLGAFKHIERQLRIKAG